MARNNKKRINANINPPPHRQIQSGSRADVLDDLLRFSFKFYDPDHPEINCKDREPEYFRKLLDRIKDLSKERVSALTNSRPNSATRFHRIDFREDRVSVNGFGIKGWSEYEEDAWQFSVSVNKHGRVCGFLIENVFYVVWLDPGHDVYPKKR